METEIFLDTLNVSVANGGKVRSPMPTTGKNAKRVVRKSIQSGWKSYDTVECRTRTNHIAANFANDAFWANHVNTKPLRRERALQLLLEWRRLLRGRGRGQVWFHISHKILLSTI